MKDQIRILHTITRLDKGGSSENTLLSVIGLARKGYSVDLLSGYTLNPDEVLIQRAKESGVNLIAEDSLIRSIHPLRDIVAFFKILRLICRGKYDIVHAHSSKAGFVCRIAAKCAGVKHIIYTPHGHVFYRYFGKAFTSIIIYAERLIAGITERIVGLTPAECDEWVDFGIGKKDMYVSVPSGIEFGELEKQTQKGKNWREELGISKETVLVGSIGRFVEIKGFNYFVDAAISQLRKRDDISFILAGDGPLHESYIQKINAEGFENRFHIIPWQENQGAVIKALDIFVLSSLNEGMGRVLIEAMFFSKPVIGTCVGGVPSVISGGTGVLINPASSVDISEAIDRLLEDPEEAGKMVQKARENVLANYSANNMVEGLDMLYKEVLKQ